MQRPSAVPGEIDAVRLEKRYLRKDGSAVWVHFSMVVRARRRRQAAYEIAVCRRHHRAARRPGVRCSRAQARFRQTFELAASGIAHVGLDGRFMRVNRSLCEILGYAEDRAGRHAR